MSIKFCKLFLFQLNDYSEMMKAINNTMILYSVDRVTERGRERTHSPVGVM